jgi:hypothetical protein
MIKTFRRFNRLILRRFSDIQKGKEEKKPLEYDADYGGVKGSQLPNKDMIDSYNTPDYDTPHEDINTVGQTRIDEEIDKNLFKSASIPATKTSTLEKETYKTSGVCYYNFKKGDIKFEDLMKDESDISKTDPFKGCDQDDKDSNDSSNDSKKNDIIGNNDKRH